MTLKYFYQNIKYIFIYNINYFSEQTVSETEWSMSKWMKNKFKIDTKRHHVSQPAKNRLKILQFRVSLEFLWYEMFNDQASLYRNASNMHFNISGGFSFW